MPTPSDWIAGARPRTLPAAVAPVLAGTGVAAYADGLVWWKALLALVVSLALQVGVNYANDYSDGVRGTDDDRVGPMRLVGSGRAEPAAVRRAAFAAFGVAARRRPRAGRDHRLVAGRRGRAVRRGRLVLHRRRQPYGYLGLGEVMVFVFFGLVAVVGTTYVQTETFEEPALYAAVGIGALACAILVVNNLRDIPTDRVAGKRTLAVRLGERPHPRPLPAARRRRRGSRRRRRRRARPGGHCSAWASSSPPRRPLRPCMAGATGPALVPVLQQTGIAEMVWALGVVVGLG